MNEFINLSEAFEGALISLVPVFAFYFFFYAAKNVAEDAVRKASKFSVWQYYVKVALIVVVIAVIYAFSYGAHTESGDNYDGLWDHGETVQDFIPSPKERNTQGVKIFIVLLVPILAGTYTGLRSNNTIKN